ncbi:MAG: hypothetical protein Hals2KO_17950 [Halioglobus sp.]
MAHVKPTSLLHFLAIGAYRFLVDARQHALAHPGPATFITGPRGTYCSTVLLAALAALAPLAVASGQDNQVNERLPVSVAEREAHWGLDCTALVTQLASGALACPVTDDTQRELELCSFIHQPPGDDHGQPCPNYRDLLQRARQSTCQDLQAYTQQLNCRNTPQRHQ